MKISTSSWHETQLWGKLEIEIYGKKLNQDARWFLLRLTRKFSIFNLSTICEMETSSSMFLQSFRFEGWTGATYKGEREKNLPARTHSSVKQMFWLFVTVDDEKREEKERKRTKLIKESAGNETFLPSMMSHWPAFRWNTSVTCLWRQRNIATMEKEFLFLIKTFYYPPLKEKWTAVNSRRKWKWFKFSTAFHSTSSRLKRS